MIDPTTLASWADHALGFLELLDPAAAPIAEALRGPLAQLVLWVATELEKGGDPKGQLYALMLSEADTAAAAAEKAKFGP